MPLFRCPPDEVLQVIGQQLCGPRDRLAQAALPVHGQRWLDDRVVAVHLRGEVDRSRQDGGLRPHAEHRRSGGQGCGLAEEGHLHPATLDVAVTEETHDLVSPQRGQDRTRRIRSQRYDIHAEAAAQFREPLEQFRRVERFHDHGHAVPLVSHPAAGPFPPAEVRQREDDTVSLLQALLDVVEAFHREATVDVLPADGRKTEALGVVAHVTVECLLRLLPECEPRHGRVDATEMSLDHPPLLPQRQCDARRKERHGTLGHEPRGEPRNERPEFVPTDGQGAGDLLDGVSHCGYDGVDGR